LSFEMSAQKKEGTARRALKRGPRGGFQGKWGRRSLRGTKVPLRPGRSRWLRARATVRDRLENEGGAVGWAGGPANSRNKRGGEVCSILTVSAVPSCSTSGLEGAGGRGSFRVRPGAGENLARPSRGRKKKGKDPAPAQKTNNGAPEGGGGDGASERREKRRKETGGKKKAP